MTGIIVKAMMAGVLIGVGGDLSLIPRLVLLPAAGNAVGALVANACADAFTPPAD